MISPIDLSDYECDSFEANSTPVSEGSVEERVNNCSKAIGIPEFQTPSVCTDSSEEDEVSSKKTSLSQDLGQFALKFPDGTIYKGGLKNGLYEGLGEIQYPSGEHFKGYFSKGRKEGMGTSYFQNGITFEAFFRKDKPMELGTYTVKEGESLSLEFKNGISVVTLDVLGTSIFVKLLLGTLEIGGFESIIHHAMTVFLKERNDVNEANELGSALFFNPRSPEDIKRMAESIFLKISNQESVLLRYGSFNHVLGLKISSTKERLFFDIYNSGDGIEFHKCKVINQKQKIQTKRRIIIPIQKLNIPWIEEILGYQNFPNIKKAYEILLKVDGAELRRSPEDGAIWQTKQKGNNCSIEWIFAYLKNTMDPKRYLEMRLDLFKTCRKKIEGAPFATDEIKKELERKIAKREEKLSSLTQAKIETPDFE